MKVEGGEEESKVEDNEIETVIAKDSAKKERDI
jgi:hypothetical protein